MRPVLVTLCAVPSSRNANVTRVPFAIDRLFGEKAMFRRVTVFDPAPAATAPLPATATTAAASPSFGYSLRRMRCGPRVADIVKHCARRPETDHRGSDRRPQWRVGARKGCVSGPRWVWSPLHERDVHLPHALPEAADRGAVLHRLVGGAR